MSDSQPLENDFLIKITEIIMLNISNEQFGVSELAREIGMSRSNLLRKVKKLTKISVSQFIRQVRLKEAMEMLKESSLNVSEISYKVGFNSTSYFIKCFHDYFGHPPGETGKLKVVENDSVKVKDTSKNKKVILILSVIFSVILIISLFVVFRPFSSKEIELEKSIAVLPFKNDSNDSTNVHIINGLMESVLTNLQKIEELRVISRTSVEKYRNTSKIIPDIAKELNVSYFVEGSGQKIGNKILLNIQLIEAATDKHLWAKQYNREAKDVFSLQMEVAKNIAKEIEAIITPEEEERINKIPTENLEAYDYFLKGRELFFTRERENIEEAIIYFKKAVELDDKFAYAYADLAISYFFLDVLQTEKKFTSEIRIYSDKAFLLDSKLTQSLIAKALFYMHSADYDSAEPYLEKALEYNPNSALVINSLLDFYANYVSNTGKYLEYAIRAIGIDIAAQDSVDASNTYLHISNAFIQSGFTNEAERYIYKSLEYNRNNIYSHYVKAYILYAKNRNLAETKKLLIETLKRDTTRIDVVQEIGKICYYMRDYEASYQYYKVLIEVREKYSLDIYRHDNAEIGVVFSKLGMNEESEKYLNDFMDFAKKNDKSLYKHLNLALIYSYRGNVEKAINEMKLFSEQKDYHYWTIIFTEIDPLIDNIKDNPEFKETLKIIKNNFWENHKKIKSSLEEKGLL